METITINSVPGFDEWRIAARACLAQAIPPENIIWQSAESVQDDLFGDSQQPIAATKPQKQHAIPKACLLYTSPSPRDRG